VEKARWIAGNTEQLQVLEHAHAQDWPTGGQAHLA